MAITSAIFAVVGTGVGIDQRNQANRDQRAAEKLSKRQNDLANQRRIRQSVAAARAEQAALVAASAGQDSSGLQGGIASSQTQLAANAGFATQTANANNRANRFIGSANRNLNQAQTAQALGSLGSQLGFTVKDAGGDLNNLAKGEATNSSPVFNKVFGR